MFINVDIPTQTMTLFDELGEVVRDYRISTAKNGSGERINSNCTPRGWHVVRVKIGEGVPENAVFVARRPTGEIYSENLKKQHPDRDWILTRILWLSGLEPGFNRLGDVDTMRRYIYIHGAPDDSPIGTPASAGCIQMRNQELIEMFDRVEVGTLVNIRD